MHPATAKLTGLITGGYFGSVFVAQAASGSPSIEDTLRSAVAQAPALVVLVILAVFFLRAMAAKDSAFADAQGKSRADYLESLKGLMTSHQAQWAALHAEHLEERREIHSLIEKQLEAMRTMSSAIATCPAKQHPA